MKIDNELTYGEYLEAQRSLEEQRVLVYVEDKDINSTLLFKLEFIMKKINKDIIKDKVLNNNTFLLLNGNDKILACVFIKNENLEMIAITKEAEQELLEKIDHIIK
jgi:hypothetical protein